MATDTKDSEPPVEVRKLSTQQDQENAEEVAEAIAIEHTLSFWDAVKLYPKAIGWSMYFSLGVIMLCTLRELFRSAGLSGSRVSNNSQHLTPSCSATFTPCQPSREILVTNLAMATSYLQHGRLA